MRGRTARGGQHTGRVLYFACDVCVCGTPSLIKTGKRMSARLALDDVGLKPSAAVLQPCAAHVASASDSLRCLEQRLADRASLDSDVAAATTLVVDAATELRAAFAFIDQLEESVASASLLIEATERRLAVYERGERLPESLLSLPPAMLTHHQFLRQLQRRECHPLPDLPELTMLPPPSTRPSEPWPGCSSGCCGRRDCRVHRRRRRDCRRDRCRLCCGRCGDDFCAQRQLDSGDSDREAADRGRRVARGCGRARGGA